MKNSRRNIANAAKRAERVKPEFSKYERKTRPQVETVLEAAFARRVAREGYQGEGE